MATSIKRQKLRADDNSAGKNSEGSSNMTSPHEEFDALFAELSYTKPTRKEIESTESGGASTFVDTFLPSFFDHYPRAKRAAKKLREEDRDIDAALDLLRAGKRLLVFPSELRKFESLISRALEGEEAAGTSTGCAITVEVDGNDEDNEGSGTSRCFLWQVDGGDHGWLDFDDDANAVCEMAYSRFVSSSDPSPPSEVSFRGHQGNSYRLNFNFMIQRNTATGMHRPVRRVPV